MIAALAVTLLLAGCFTARPSPAPPSSTGTGQPAPSKQTFLARLIGLCAGVDERLAAVSPSAPPGMVADEFEGLVQQVLAGKIPDQDREKLDRMIAAFLDVARKQRALAQSPSTTGTPAATTASANQAAKSAMQQADTAAQAYGMPPLADCPKAVKVESAVWQTRQRAPLAVQQAGGAVVDGAVWVVGGITEAAATARVASYDPVLNSWTPGPDLPIPLHHAMAVDYHDELVVLGGFTARGSELTADTSGAVYRLTGGRWESMPPLIHPRAAGAAVVVGGTIVVVGGRDTQALVQPTEIFDGTRWHEAAPLPIPGDHLAAVTDGTSVYVVGGRALNAARNTAALQKFDPAQDRWSQLQGMPAPRGGLGAVYVDGRIVTAGGEGVAMVFGDCNAYDIKAGTWTPLASLRTPRHGLVLAAVGRRVFAIGGATRPNHTGSTDAVSEMDLDQSTSASSSPTSSPTSTPAPSSSAAALGDAGICPDDRISPVRACLTRAVARQGQLDVAFTVTVQLSTVQDSAHRHLHFFLANPDGHGGTDPDASVIQAMAPNPGSWFNVYSPDVKVIDASTEQGGTKRGLDLQDFSLLCVRVADGAHGLVADRSGHLRTGNCVTIAR